MREHLASPRPACAGVNLQFIRVFVSDLAAAQAFYAEVIGLRMISGGPRAGFCVFDAGPVQLIVESVPPDAPADEQSLVGRFTGLSFAVPDVEASHKELVGKGVEFTGDPERQSWGGVLATFRDPAGNQLQIVQARSA
jgi:catechol 2,3-dioxygenase-like lactoylglutathione lyase family enzyme